MPTLEISEETHRTKYRSVGETFEDACSRIAAATADSDEHRKAIKELLLNESFLPAGRIQSAAGSPRVTTPFNCYVSGIIEDNAESIMKRAGEAFQTMRLGGGIGYDFSLLRPRGDHIASLDSIASGPVSFMGIYDSICKTVSSAGHRRGAQMGVLRVDHPDIEEFIDAKHNTEALTSFNISIGITDDFMRCVTSGNDFPLSFGGRVYKYVNARKLWDKIMRSTWDWAEPGVLYIDRINEMNNLWYNEEIAATNPCAEQPLPEFGACLLGSFNLTKYLRTLTNGYPGINQELYFDYVKLAKDVPVAVRMLDNIIDGATFPLERQELEAKRKRRMGLGVTGLANAIEGIGYLYGSQGFLNIEGRILQTLRDSAYIASVQLAKEKGPFPYYDERFCESKFVKTLTPVVQGLIRKHGIRNSHLLSIAPTGTISLCADNVSSGIEPVFSLKYDRTIQTEEGPKTVEVSDYGLREFGVKGKTADKVTVREHLDVLITAQKYTDSAVSKTCNVGDDVTWEEFKEIYMTAWREGAKGCTTFRAAGKRFGILVAKPDEEEEGEESKVEACFIDPATGKKSCE